MPVRIRPRAPERGMLYRTNSCFICSAWSWPDTLPRLHSYLSSRNASVAALCAHEAPKHSPIELSLLP